MGFGATPDGPGYALSLLATVSLPLASRLYARAEAFMTYFRTQTDDSTGFEKNRGGPARATYLIGSHTLGGIRALLGHELSPYVGVRGGAIIGMSSLSVSHGLCFGPEPFRSFLVGGHAAFVVHAAIAEFGLGLDAYVAQTRVHCDSAAGFSLIPDETFGAVLAAQTTFLF